MLELKIANLILLLIPLSQRNSINISIKFVFKYTTLLSYTLCIYHNFHTISVTVTYNLTLKGRHFLPNINDWGGAQSAPPIFLPNECSDKKKLNIAFKIKVI